MCIIVKYKYLYIYNIYIVKFDLESIGVSMDTSIDAMKVQYKIDLVDYIITSLKYRRETLT